MMIALAIELSRTLDNGHCVLYKSAQFLAEALKMIRNRSLARVHAWSLLLLVGSLGAFTASCGGDVSPRENPPPSGPQCAASLNTNPQGALWMPVVDPADPLAASFDVTIDPAHAAFMTEQREPLAAPMTVTATNGTLKLWGGVKKFVKHPERLFVELYFINDDKVGWREATVTVDGIEGSASFYDFNEDPWAMPTTNQTMRLGGIAPEGVGRISFGFDAQADNAPVKFKVSLAGKTTTRISTSSSPITTSPDGKEVWAVQGDADVLGIIDTTTDKRVAQIKTPGKPSSVAITPDGKLALVTCSACNQVSVINTATREIVQIFGEADGIGRDPRNIVVSPDGTRAYVSAYVGDSVTAFERVGDAFRVVKELPIGRRPVGMSVTPDGETLLVAHFMPKGKVTSNGAWLSVIATDTNTVVKEPFLPDDGNEAEIGCMQQISLFANYSAEDLSFEASPTQFAGVFLAPGGAEAWAPGLRVAGFPMFEGDVSTLGFQFLALGANSPAMFFPFDTRNARETIIRKASSSIDVPDRIEEFLRCVPFYEEAEAVIARTTNNPDERTYPGATIPSQSVFLSETGVSRFMGFTRGGRRTLILSYIADELAVMDTATHSPTSVNHLLLSGSNPTGIAVTPNGVKGYVAYENSTFVSVLDLSMYAKEGALPEPGIVPYYLGAGTGPGQGAAIVTFKFLTRNIKDVPDAPLVEETGQVEMVDADPMDPVMRRGKILFTSSSPVKYPTLSGHRQGACAACHPNGGNDGTAWSTMEGERRTIGLWGGTAKRGWLHASATHQDATDFATKIVVDRLGGTGLSNADVHALSEYVAHGIPEVQRPKVDSKLAEKGKTIFQTKCSSCHFAPDYSSGNPDGSTEYGGGKGEPTVYDVGTTTDWGHITLGTAYVNLFPSDAQLVLTLLRGDRDLGSADPVQQKLKFAARPDRKRGQIKASSLVNTWENQVFFHDARTDSLEEAVGILNTNLALALSAEDIKAVVEYLKTL